MVLPMRPQFEDKILTTVTRRLPGPGKIVVRIGDKVTPEDPVGTAEVSGGSRRINVAQILGISAVHADKAIVKRVGEMIYRGEPLAKHRRALGLRNKVYLSPVDGMIDVIGGGEVTIRSAPNEVSVPAEFAGVISEVKEGEAVEVRLSAQRFTGLVGTGGQCFGEIKLVGGPDQVISPQDIDGNFSGKIAVGGALLPAETIVKGLAIGVRAFFSGGVNFHDTLNWSQGYDNGLTVVSLEGYGQHEIREELWRKLTEAAGKTGALSGQDKTLLMPISASGKEAESVSWCELRSGDTVRVVSGEEQGLVGVAVGASTAPVTLPSGLFSEVVKIKVQGKEKSFPWKNLEIIETK